MPTAQLTYDDNPGAAAVEHMQREFGAALAEISRQVEIALVVELAKLAPQERRLFRAELQEIQSNVNHDTTTGTWTTEVWCDPPKVWMVERGSPEDNMTDEQACMLIKAGAAQCRFDTDGDCHVALCDHCHPEAWV